MSQNPIDQDDARVRELFERAGSDVVGLAPSASARQHAERGRTRRRTGAAAAAVVVVVGATAFVTWPRAEPSDPVVTPSPTVTAAPAPTSPAPTGPAPSSPQPPPTSAAPPPSSAPVLPATLAAGLPVLPITDDPVVEGRDVTENDRTTWTFVPCGAFSDQEADPSSTYPAQAVETRRVDAAGSESGIYEDVVLMPDAGSATTTFDELRAAWAACGADGDGDRTLRLLDVPDVGDRAFMVVTDFAIDGYADTSYSVVVQVGPTLGAYTFALPGTGPTTYADSPLVGLVEEFVAAASAQ